MMRDHKPISIADQLFEKLERDILSGKYPQGEILSALRLSGELGVSRTPIREAIRRLEQERILEDSGHGLVVNGISRQDKLNIYEISLQLEDLSAKRAAASITDDVLSEMKEVLDLQRFYIESEKEPGENSDQIKNLDYRFNELLYICCGCCVSSSCCLYPGSFRAGIYARNAAGNGKGAGKMIRCFLILTLAVMIKVAFDIHNHKVDVRTAEAGANL